MRVTATVGLDTVKGENGVDTGELSGAVVMNVEWFPDSDLEDILLRHLLSDGAHETATAETANFGHKLISTIRLQSDRLDAAKMEMSMYQEWKQKGGNWEGQAVDFERFKALKAEAQAAAVHTEE